MNLRRWKKLWVASLIAAAAAPAFARADPLCVYVLGHLGSRTVATPAIMIVVPDTSATMQPVRVHVAPNEQTILGYSLRLPGQDSGADAKSVFVPGITRAIPPIVATLPMLDLDMDTCVSLGMSTPAVPVYVPHSALQAPGVIRHTPSIELNILGHSITAPGHVIQLEDKTIVIPSMEALVPGVSPRVPARSIGIKLNGAVQTAEYLEPAKE